jgi:hypothetical protein
LYAVIAATISYGWRVARQRPVAVAPAEAINCRSVAGLVNFPPPFKATNLPILIFRIIIAFDGLFVAMAMKRKAHRCVTVCSLDEMNDHSVCFTASGIFAFWSFHAAEFHLYK